ncbi:hypothetical protein EGW08_021745 [Elysia chlorotica]|uniref:Uncharacterized protein n=1 Tax=Elysia chlorotica TaxID=188477 RepID=A0A433SMR2_ELYCH|nr:hypothetical protein EGW08_021745 [Elysia chlorotica]
MSHSQPRPMPSVYFPPTPDKTIELYNVPTTLQGHWTTNILQPLEERMADALDITSRDEENCEMAKVTFMTSPAGITSVSAPMTGNLSPPPEVKFEFKDESLPMRVQVEPDIQSGGVVKGLPNFLELGVSDTYTPEEILVNKELVCGGEVRMKEERSFALPIFIDMTQFICPSAKNNAQQDQIDSSQDPVCTSQESGSPSYFPSLPQSNQQATFVPQQYSETEQMQSDFELGQTLEISDGSYCNQDQYSTNSKYNTFTPQANDETPYLEENNCAEPTDIKGCPLPVSTAYSNAVKTILNDVLLTCNTFKCSVRDPYTGTIPESPEPQQAVETRHAQVARVEIQVIEQADSLPLPDLPEEDLPDLFEIGSM